MSEGAQVESDKLFWGEIGGAVDAEDSYKLDIFSLPLPLLSKHVLDRGVCTEKSKDKRAPSEVGTCERKRTKMEQTKKQPGQLLPTTKQAGRDAQDTGMDAPRKKEVNG